MESEKNDKIPEIPAPPPMETEETPANEPKDLQQPPFHSENPPTEEKTSTPGAPKKPKRVRKKKPKDALAPKLPLSGYNFFMRDNRPQILERNPDANIQEITKKVAQEWGSLPEDIKLPYLQRAEEEKRRYAREMGEYKKFKLEQGEEEAPVESENGSPTKKKKATSGKQNQEAKEADIKTPEPTPVNQQVNAPAMTNGKISTTGPVSAGQTYAELLKKRSGDYEIPIFTDSFLEHNKALDSELRTLRKSQTDYEQQNSILEKHLENMRNGVKNAQATSDNLRDTNRMLSNYLEKLQAKLVESIGDLSIPSCPNGATLENIDQLMTELATLNSHGPAAPLNKARDIIRKADLHVQL